MAIGKELTKADWKRMLREKALRLARKHKRREDIQRKIQLRKGKGRRA